MVTTAMLELFESCKSVFIAGTDTGVGKTHTACRLLEHWADTRAHIAPFKPIECGEGREDATALLKASRNRTLSLDEINPEWLRLPASPLAASRAEGREIDRCGLIDHFEALSVRFDHLVVEGAGGWLVPVSTTYTMADLAREFALPVVVVASDRLGVLNHTLLTVQSIESAGLECRGVVLNAVPGSPPDPSLENLSQLREFLGKDRVAYSPIC